MTEDEVQDHRQDIPIADYYDRVSRERLLDPGETPRQARERVIDQIIALYPELGNDTSLLASLRGEVGFMILSVPSRYREAAPLVARAYQLLDLEYREHLERRRRRRT